MDKAARSAHYPCQRVVLPRGPLRREATSTLLLLWPPGTVCVAAKIAGIAQGGSGQGQDAGMEYRMCENASDEAVGAPAFPRGAARTAWHRADITGGEAE